MKTARQIDARLIILLGLSGAHLGCQSKLDRPDFVPQRCSAQALEQCDKNADGQIDPEEAKAAPGLALAFEQWDADGNGLISTDEFEARISQYGGASASVTSAAFTVTYKRRYLPGAVVTLEPEPFMGAGFEPVSGTTDRYGFVQLNRPNVEEDGYPGIFLGVYRVRISKQEDGQELLPPQYNTESELGIDSGSQSRSARSSPRFDLE